MLSPWSYSVFPPSPGFAVSTARKSKYFKLKKDWHYPSEGAKVSREQDTLELKSGQGAEKQGTGRIWQDKQKMGAKPEKILGSDIIQGSPPIQPLQH